MKPESVMHYFFRDGDTTRPNKQAVTREELFQVLDWYHRRVLGGRTLWERTKRLFKRIPEVSPFDWIRLERMKAGKRD